jgi:hypothetical protein
VHRLRLLLLLWPTGQGAIAAKPSATYKGYLLGGLCWFAVPFTMATSMGEWVARCACSTGALFGAGVEGAVATGCYGLRLMLFAAGVLCWTPPGCQGWQGRLPC